MGQRAGLRKSVLLWVSLGLCQRRHGPATAVLRARAFFARTMIPVVGFERRRTSARDWRHRGGARASPGRRASGVAGERRPSITARAYERLLGGAGSERGVGRTSTSTHCAAECVLPITESTNSNRRSSGLREAP